MIDPVDSLMIVGFVHDVEYDLQYLRAGINLIIVKSVLRKDGLDDLSYFLVYLGVYLVAKLIIEIDKVK